MTTILADNPQAVQPKVGSCLFMRTCPSCQIEFKEGQISADSDLPQRWLQDAHFMQVLAMQHELLKPQGKAIFKYPSVEAPQLECFVTVQ